ncbi:MAG: tryptophan-rich sensory protein [Candidatus Yanofskybacteria bacterium]|nr:tryptophan-rich sensory protein [Candidatus Yanofskybacteria bacterium]
MRINNTAKLLIAVGISELAGILGTVFTVSAIPNWYSTLTKPAFNPPAWIFGPVWTILYLLMGISLWLVWKSNSKEKSRVIWLFAVQLVLNTVWSPIFFGAQSIGSALAVIVLLWAAIVLTILTFRKISKTAAWLLVPYIAWVSFAFYLNYMLWVLN